MAEKRIFLCYRREEADAVAGRLHDRLVAEFGAGGVFMDIDNVPFGVDYRVHIQNELASCDILLALMGPRWAEILRERALDARDFLRVELETAQRLGIRIAPVVLDGASLPEPDDLPASFVLRDSLSYLNGLPLRRGADFASDYQRIAKGIRAGRGGKQREVPTQWKQVVLIVLLASAVGLAGLGLWTRATSPETPAVPKIIKPESSKTAPPTNADAARLAAAEAVAAAREVAPPADNGNIRNAPRADPSVPVPSMRFIPGGSFEMGSPETESGRFVQEGPRHTVTLRAFELGEFEVTFEEYDAFAKATGRPLPGDTGWGRGTRPVTNVSWKDATDYAAWLSARTGQDYRLPSEAEWEYGVRGGTDTVYSWGDDIHANGVVTANCDGCGSEWDGKSTAPVGSFIDNGFGLHDMHGNVWEWTADCWHVSYRGAPADGQAWGEPERGDCGKRVIRGGSWGDGPQTLRSAFRSGTGSDRALALLGFRLARTLR